MLYWCFETIPRQFPPRSTGPSSGRERDERTASTISSSSPCFPVSAKPPGIRMIDSALPVSASARIASRAPSAGIETTARSTGCGRSATVRTHGIPSIVSSFG